MRLALICSFVASILLAPLNSHASWPFNGLPLALQPSAQTTPVAVPDGLGGVIIAWADERLSNTIFDREVYAQRVDVNGNPVWDFNDTRITGAFGDQPFTVGGLDVASDGAGGAFIAWDSDDGTVIVQKLDATGQPQWGNPGVTIFGSAQTESQPRLVADATGGVIVAYHEDIAGFNGIGVDRLNAAGFSTWSESVVIQISPASDHRVVFDGTNTFVAWVDGRGAFDEIYAQKLDGNGVNQWTPDGVVVSDDVSNGVNDISPRVFSDNAAGIMVTWINEGTSNVYVRRVGTIGSPLWSSYLVNIFTTAADNYDAVSDRSGGTILCWIADDAGLKDVFAQRVGPGRNPYWPVHAKLSTSSVTELDLRATSTGDGGAIVMWSESQGTSAPLRAQRVSPLGLNLWDDAGVEVTGIHYGSGLVADIATGANGDAFITWEMDVGLGETDVYAQRVDPWHGGWGHPEPTITSVTDVPVDQGGEVIVAWDASDHDVQGISGIDYYSVWRALETSARIPGDKLVTPDRIERDFAGEAFMMSGGIPFEWLVNQDAFRLPSYGFTASTIIDSTGADPGNHYFQVIAHDFAEAFVSLPDSGYSVDNLAPGAPFLLAAVRTTGDNVDLDWSPSGFNEPDFLDYVIYRRIDSGTSMYEFLTTSPDTVATDSAATSSEGYYYIVVARDIHGNESLPTNEAMVTGTPTGIGDRTPSLATLQLLPNAPNPFSNRTSFSFGLPEPADVSVEVFDVRGRRVYQEDLGRKGAGWQRVGFSARGNDGRLLPSGVYFYRVKAADVGQTRKMVIRR